MVAAFATPSFADNQSARHRAPDGAGAQRGANHRGFLYIAATDLCVGV
jgi:hypothetical protein